MNRERALRVVLTLVGLIFLRVSAHDVLVAQRLALAAASAGV
jgi:hypothetical protein